MNKFSLMVNDSNFSSSDRKHIFKIVKIMNYGQIIDGIADIISGDTAAMSIISARCQIGKMIDADDWCQMSHSSGYEYIIVE